jgi:prepilin-type N-terminal cleavage/methylation domain-containing protein
MLVGQLAQVMTAATAGITTNPRVANGILQVPTPDLSFRPPKRFFPPFKKADCTMSMRNQRGFSVVEVLIVTVLITIMTGITFITLQPALRHARFTSAYNTTLMAMRQARENAVSQRGAYRVTFNNGAAPNTVSIVPVTTAMAACGGLVAAAQWAGSSNFTYSLPAEVGFRIVPGVPTAPTQTPDGFGIAAFAIDFDQGVGLGGATSVVFCPDGSAQDTLGNYNNGVVYLARASELYSSRAITLWGITGRLRGWQLVQNGACGTTCWSQQ